jgi:signal transduction histidine kinase
VIEPVDVHALVAESFRLLSVQAEKKGITLVNDVSETMRVESDINMLNIVIRNLIQNAIKFTPIDGQVSVGLKDEAGHKLIQVTDTGVGMDADKVSKLFDIRTNKTTEGTSQEKGSGLGLVLCKELIEKVNGLIEVSSKPGAGSVFTLKF